MQRLLSFKTVLLSLCDQVVYLSIDLPENMILKNLRQYFLLNQLWIWLARECLCFCGKFGISFIFSNLIENSVSDSCTTLA